MKLLVIVLCLLSERFLTHSFSYQRFSWFNDYARRVNEFTQQHQFLTNPWVKLALMILPLTLVTALIYGLLQCLFFGFVGLVLSIVIFFYCLGPQNPFYPMLDNASGEEGNGLASHYFSAVNNQLFAVIFWYIVSGPIGVLIFRLISLSSNVIEVSQEAKKVQDILEWAPARLTVLLYLLVGDFQRGFILFKKYMFSKPQLNNQMISECGLEAVRADTAEEVPMPIAELIVEHSLIVLLVFIALFTLVAWL